MPVGLLGLVITEADRPPTSSRVELGFDQAVISLGSRATRRREGSTQTSWNCPIINGSTVDPHQPDGLGSGMDERQLELWSLREFTAVAATSSMTVASARLGLTQSAVSQAACRTGRAFGVALVEPGKRPIVLTAAGRLLASRDAALERADCLCSVKRAPLARTEYRRCGLQKSIDAALQNRWHVRSGTG